MSNYLFEWFSVAWRVAENNVALVHSPWESKTFFAIRLEINAIYIVWVHHQTLQIDWPPFHRVKPHTRKTIPKVQQTFPKIVINPILFEFAFSFKEGNDWKWSEIRKRKCHTNSICRPNKQLLTVSNVHMNRSVILNSTISLNNFTNLEENIAH